MMGSVSVRHGWLDEAKSERYRRRKIDKWYGQLPFIRGARHCDGGDRGAATAQNRTDEKK